ncbi:MAG TPA: hypothetical protein VKW76_00090 [Candidatus Binatia bacterium]|nr:hypothetical protein [Candidatus Binatia bacterium]
MAHQRKMAWVSLAAALALSTAPAAAQAPDVFEINYFANANTDSGADATVRITNPGANGAPSPAGDLCALIYVFTADQQMAECCGCPVSPNGLRTLSVTRDLTDNPLTGVLPTTGALKIVSSTPTATGSCDPTSPTPTPELIAWATHVQKPWVSGGTVAITETAFEDASLGSAELADLTSKCGAIFDNGSGHGVCTCGRGE